MSAEGIFSREAVASVSAFLASNIPRSNIGEVNTQLKKDFLLARKTAIKLKKKARRKDRTENGRLTRKQKKALGYYVKMPRHLIKYKDCLPIHQMWTEYIWQMLDLGTRPVPDRTSKDWEQFARTLYKSDFNGSMLEVVRAKCPTRVGLKGICIMETKGRFRIVSENNVTTLVPKSECVFDVSVKNIKITIFGSDVVAKPPERSTKKLKAVHHHPDDDFTSDPAF